MAVVYSERGSVLDKPTLRYVARYLAWRCADTNLYPRANVPCLLPRLGAHGGLRSNVGLL